MHRKNTREHPAFCIRLGPILGHSAVRPMSHLGERRPQGLEEIVFEATCLAACEKRHLGFWPSRTTETMVIELSARSD